MGAKLRRSAAFLCGALLVQGCATDGTLSQARNQFYSGQPQAALKTLEDENVSRRDRLLLHLDRGLIAHTSGQYRQSIDAFLKAAALIEELNYISISEQTSTLITNEWASTYKGEFSERLWVHSFQMMNFLLLDDPEGAAVEARQALKLFQNHPDSLDQDWFTRALLALSFEAVGQRDSAHIEYTRLFDDSGGSNGVARAAWQNAMLLGRTDDASRFAKAFPTNAAADAQYGEIIVFVASGSIEPKIPGDIVILPDSRISFPYYPEQYNSPVSINVFAHSSPVARDSVSTQLVDVSRAALGERGKSLAAKHVLRFAAKKEISRAVRAENSALGGLLTAVFFILEQADTRSWETLPAQLSLLRIPLPAGDHQLDLSVDAGLDSYSITLPRLSVSVNKRVFYALRLGAGAPVGRSADLPES